MDLRQHGRQVGDGGSAAADPQPERVGAAFQIGESGGSGRPHVRIGDAGADVPAGALTGRPAAQER